MRKLNDQYKIQDQILKERLDVILGEVMEESGIESWLISCLEYNEDPIFHHVVPSLYPTARRLTILLFVRKDGKTECYNLGRPDPFLNQYYTQAYNPKEEEQYAAVERVLREINPKNIAIDVSENGYAYTDGLTHSLYEELLRELPKDLTDRFVSADEVGIRLLETRTPTELEVYPEVMGVAMDIIERAFSDEVITPGVTTCRDVMDFMAQEVNDLGITTWFNPTIDLQNEKGMLEEDAIINKGDLVHCDFGIVYLNLCTDTQRLCYILKDEEDDMPEELAEAMKRNNRFQDIVRANMQPGRTGNDVFVKSVEEGKAEGLRPFLYSHPCGLFGHSAGPTIGLWTNQNPIPVKGDRKLYLNTSYALELSILEYLDMYQKDTYIFTEETVILTEEGVSFLAENRDRIKVIRGGK